MRIKINAISGQKCYISVALEYITVWMVVSWFFMSLSRWPLVCKFVYGSSSELLETQAAGINGKKLQNKHITRLPAGATMRSAAESLPRKRWNSRRNSRLAFDPDLGRRVQQHAFIISERSSNFRALFHPLIACRAPWCPCRSRPRWCWASECPSSSRRGSGTEKSAKGTEQNYTAYPFLFLN